MENLGETELFDLCKNLFQQIKENKNKLKQYKKTNNNINKYNEAGDQEIKSKNQSRKRKIKYDKCKRVIEMLNSIKNVDVNLDQDNRCKKQTDQNDDVRVKSDSEECNKTYKSHLIDHNYAVKYEKEFTTRKSLRYHSVVHQNQKFKCSYKGCDKKFISKKYLKFHQDNHSNQLKCSLVNCSFKTMFHDKLKRHMKIHDIIMVHQEKYQYSIN